MEKLRIRGLLLLIPIGSGINPAGVKMEQPSGRL